MAPTEVGPCRFPRGSGEYIMYVYEQNENYGELGIRRSGDGLNPYVVDLARKRGGVGQIADVDLDARSMGAYIVIRDASLSKDS